MLVASRAAYNMLCVAGKRGGSMIRDRAAAKYVCKRICNRLFIVE